MEDLRKKLLIPSKRLQEINDILIDPKSTLVNDFLEMVTKFGTPEEINAKALEAGKVDNLLVRLEKVKPEYVKDLKWLIEQRDNNKFITVADYRKKVLGDKAEKMEFNEDFAVTLELSALQYFPDFMTEVRQTIEKGELLPGRFIRVRTMAEQMEDGDLLAVCAAMQIIGATWCETLDTKGTDGSNVHLGGPATITGYFGGVGQPNDHPLKWAEELLKFYTEYGVKQVLNINPGTVLVGYMLHKIGIDIEFKISVFMGNDNPFAIFWTIMMARLLSRDDGTSPLIGFNFSNSVNNKTIRISSEIRNKFDFDDNIRFEHHILETYEAIVRQPYDRRNSLMDIAKDVKNISAKHEGGDLDYETKTKQPSNILDYFVAKADHVKNGTLQKITENFLEKHRAVNNTAKALTEHGLTFIAATKCHL